MLLFCNVNYIQLLRPHGMSCPRYDQILDENTQTDYYKQVNKDHEVCIVCVVFLIVHTIIRTM